MWWADFGRPQGCAAGYRRPVVVVQSNDYNRSGISTAVVVPLTTNLALAQAPGNVLCRPRASGLPKPSVANVSLVTAVDRSHLLQHVGRLPETVMREVSDGLRLLLSL